MQALIKTERKTAQNSEINLSTQLNHGQRSATSIYNGYKQGRRND